MNTARYFNVTKSFSAAAIAAAVAFAGAQRAFAAGYEKATFWGAHEAALGGAATPWVTGADALYYNPAGLVKDKPGAEISLQLSPTWSTTSGPVDFQNDGASSSTIMTMLPGLLVDYTINDQWAVSIGAYASGGAKAEIDNVAFLNSVAKTATVYTNLGIMEYALGVGYKMNDSWKFGASYRIVSTSAEFGLVQPLQYGDTNDFLNAQVLGAKGTNYQSFKLGTQYKVAQNTLLGLTFRSEAILNGAGTFGGTFSSQQVGAPLPIDQTPATAHTVLPMAVTVGVQQTYANWRAIAEYVWTQYSRVGEIAVDGVMTVHNPQNGATVLSVAGVHVAENWQDQHEVRLAGEYLGWSWPLRFAYVLQTRVTDANNAVPTLYPPGLTHTFSVGSGQTWFGNLTTDFAAEYLFASASGGVNAAGAAEDTGGNFSRSGTFALNAYALHLGATYAF